MKNIITMAFVLLGLNLMAQSQKQLIPTTSDKFEQLIKTEKKLVILDVRTPMEFNQGHIKGAINIDANRPDAMTQINKLDKKAVYLIYCRTRNRSGYIGNAMLQSGFEKIYQLTDGIVGWNANGLPLQ